MHDLATTDPPPAAVPAPTPAEVLQGALIDSRRRWRELVDLAADFAFETDEWGRFTLITPDPALDWAAGSLIGEPSAALLAEGGGDVFDPFRVSARVRHRKAWLKRGDGSTACLAFSASPILDAGGRITGVRGVGIDTTELDGQAAQMARALRRSEVVDHLMRCIAREVLASHMIASGLAVLIDALAAEGIAIVLASTGAEPAQVPHVTGMGTDAVLALADRQLHLGASEPMQVIAPDRRRILVAACPMRSGEKAGLVAWRPPDARAWDGDDCLLMGSGSRIIRMLLEREAIQYDMARQARTDSLTGLLNRRAFMEEMERHAARQQRDNLPATLIFADLDNFKPVNDRLGHEAGDEVLRQTAALLRKTFRPSDLVARLGGDEFAIWMNGADHMTAAERAEYLRDAVPRELSEITGPDLPRVGVSIGIACREAADGEPLDSLMRRADRAMYEVKRGGRGHWRVSLRRRP